VHIGIGWIEQAACVAQLDRSCKQFAFAGGVHRLIPARAQKMLHARTGTKLDPVMVRALWCVLWYPACEFLLDFFASSGRWLLKPSQQGI
jgi:hypothetical protein